MKNRLKIVVLTLLASSASQLCLGGEAGVIRNGKKIVLWKDGEKVNDLNPQRAPARAIDMNKRENAVYTGLDLGFVEDTDRGVICYFNYHDFDRAHDAPVSCMKK
jgi:hypothetical protein